jgi:hypothetical protein
MNRHLSALNNPSIKELVIAKIKDAKGDFKELKGAGATGLDELLFNVPSKHGKLRELIEGYKETHPHKHAVAKGLGFLGSGIVPGMAGVKVLSKIGKLGKLLKGGGLGQAISQGAVYGAAPKAVETVIKNEDDKGIKTLLGGVEGAMLGGALGGGARAIKFVGNKLKPVRKREEARQVIDKIGKKLFSQMDERDIAKMREIVSNPIDRKHVNYNTLLHRGTENTKAVADALYQVSPKARQLVGARKKELIERQMPHIEEAIIKTGGGWVSSKFRKICRNNDQEAKEYSSATIRKSI